MTVFGGNAAQGLHTSPRVDPAAGSGDRRAAGAARRPLHHRGADGGGVGGLVAPARAENGAVARDHRHRRPGAEPPRRAVARPSAAAGDGLESEQTAPRRVRRGGKNLPTESDSGSDPGPTLISAVDHAGEAVVGADIIVLVTSSPTPVLENGWVKPGAHVISVGACRPTQREMDPALVARARLFVDSRAAALVESGDVVLGIQEGRFGAGSHRRRARRAARRPGARRTPQRHRGHDLQEPGTGGRGRDRGAISPTGEPWSGESARS